MSKGKSEGVSKGSSGGKVNKVNKMQPVKKTDHAADPLYQSAKTGKESLQSLGQNSVKKAKDSKEAMRGQNFPKSDHRRHHRSVYQNRQFRKHPVWSEKK